MRVLLAMVVTALLSIGVCACGGFDKSSTAASKDAATSASDRTKPSRAASTAAYRNATADGFVKDKDNDDAEHLLTDDDNSAVRNYGNPATAPDWRAVTALLERYYVTALRGEGSSACAMIAPGLARAVPLDYGKLGPSYLHGGKTCAAVLTLLFRHEHRRLAASVPRLAVRSVRVEGEDGLALLAFGKMPEREIQVLREGVAWKMGALLDGELP